MREKRINEEPEPSGRGEARGCWLSPGAVHPAPFRKAEPGAGAAGGASPPVPQPGAPRSPLSPPPKTPPSALPAAPPHSAQLSPAPSPAPRTPQPRLTPAGARSPALLKDRERSGGRAAGGLRRAYIGRAAANPRAARQRDLPPSRPAEPRPGRALPARSGAGRPPRSPYPVRGRGSAPKRRVPPRAPRGVGGEKAQLGTGSREPPLPRHGALAPGSGRLLEGPEVLGGPWGSQPRPQRGRAQLTPRSWARRSPGGSTVPSPRAPPRYLARSVWGRAARSYGYWRSSRDAGPCNQQPLWRCEFLSQLPLAACLRKNVLAHLSASSFICSCKWQAGTARPRAARHVPPCCRRTAAPGCSPHRTETFH